MEKSDCMPSLALYKESQQSDHCNTARLGQLVSTSDWQAGVPGFESSVGRKLKWPHFFVHLNISIILMVR